MQAVRGKNTHTWRMAEQEKEGDEKLFKNANKTKDGAQAQVQRRRGILLALETERATYEKRVSVCRPSSENVLLSQVSFQPTDNDCSV